MTFTELSLPGSYKIDPDIRSDERGWFARTFCIKDFEQIGHTANWVQLNHSSTAKAGTIRGMHYQLPPFTEIKLVRCIKGAVYDVIVDLREGSPTFLNWQGVELSEDNKTLIYIPAGFAHGFQALTDNSELIYHHSAIYEPGFEKAIRYDDPLINILWPKPVTLVSDRDRNHPYLESNFKGINLSA